MGLGGICMNLLLKYIDWHLLGLMLCNVRDFQQHNGKVVNHGTVKTGKMSISEGFLQ